MERGEVWRTRLDDPRLVVVLAVSAAEDNAAEDSVAGVTALQVVPAAREEEKRGFRLLSGPETAELRAGRMAFPAGPDVRVVGVEIPIRIEPGVVRIAFPHNGFIPCTWLISLSPGELVERTGRLSPDDLNHLTDALGVADGG